MKNEYRKMKNAGAEFIPQSYSGNGNDQIVVRDMVRSRRPMQQMPATYLMQACVLKKQ
jgi:hypothetical protein